MLDHDCVVVPQVGGFVTCNAPARYIEEECLFLPPIRTVGFNERMKADDGLLARSYVEAYHCSEAEAKAMLGEQIRDLQQELWETGTYDLGSIGVLSLNEWNDVEFSPCQAGTVCPSYYGLDALLFEPLPVGVKEQEERPMPALSQTKTQEPHIVPQDGNAPMPKEEITIRLKKSWIQNVAAVAAVVLLFFLVSPDAKNTGLTTGTQAEFTRLMWMPGLQETTPGAITLPSENTTEEKSVATEDKASTAAAQPVPAPEKKNPDAVKSGYCVVVASAISEKNARHYVERLHKAGYKEAQVYKKGHMVRVVFPGYASEAEAYARMNALSDQSEEFASAWVYHIK